MDFQGLTVACWTPGMPRRSAHKHLFLPIIGFHSVHSQVKQKRQLCPAPPLTSPPQFASPLPHPCAGILTRFPFADHEPTPFVGSISGQFDALTKLMVHPISPVLLTKSGPQGRRFQKREVQQSNHLFLAYLKFENRLKSFAPIPKFDERFARQHRYEPPPEFPLALPYSGIVHHLSGPSTTALGAFHPLFKVLSIFPSRRLVREIPVFVGRDSHPPRYAIPCDLRSLNTQGDPDYNSPMEIFILVSSRFARRY
eukprot:IDg23618t1